MFKKSVILLFIVCLVCLLTFSSCALFGQSGGDDSGDDTDVPSVHNHTFGDWTIITNATCTEPGLRECVCTSCQEKRTEIIQALGHDMVNDVCSRCGYEEKET